MMRGSRSRSAPGTSGKADWGSGSRAARAGSRTHPPRPAPWLSLPDAVRRERGRGWLGARCVSEVRLCERPQLLKERSQEVTENVAEVALRQNCTYVVEPRGPSCPPRALRSGPPDDGGRAKRDERSAPRRRGHV